MMRHALRVGTLGAVLAAVAGSAAVARVYMTQQQALEAAFPAPATVTRRTLYLDEAQRRRAAELARAPVDNRIVAYYEGSVAGKVTGYAYFDTHLVRTLPETIMVLVRPDGGIARIDILSFDEPDDYFPRDRWRAQFGGRRLDDDLALDRGIRALSGATLSARAVTAAARRVLAVHRLFVAPAAP